MDEVVFDNEQESAPRTPLEVEKKSSPSVLMTMFMKIPIVHTPQQAHVAMLVAALLMLILAVMLVVRSGTPEAPEINTPEYGRTMQNVGGL